MGRVPTAGGRWGVAALTVVHGVALGWVIFEPRYLPWIDWPNHLALIELFARRITGERHPCLQWGALPGPYFSFYAVSALLGGLLGSTLAGAKLALTGAFAALVPSAVRFCRAAGTSPVLAAVAPLAGFGYALGYGFVSFCFSLPILVLALALMVEHLSRARLSGEDRWLALGAAPLLLVTHGASFLAFGLVFGFGALARAAWSRSLRPVLDAALVLLPAAVAALAMLVLAGGGGGGGLPDELFSFRPLAERLAEWRGDLLDRGSQRSLHVMRGLLVVSIVLLVPGVLQSRSRRLSPWAVLPGLLLGLLHVFGPETIWFPMEVWKISTRFGTVAALLLFLSLPVRRLGAIGGSLALVVLLALSGLQYAAAHEAFARFDRGARVYDRVRAATPDGSAVLGWVDWRALPPGSQHPAMTHLFMYHVLDGVGFSPRVFDSRFLPVRIDPSCPVERYGLYRGAPPERLPEIAVGFGDSVEIALSRNYDRVAEIEGFVVFRKKSRWP